MAAEQQSRRSSSAAPVSIGFRSRRGSIASLTSRGPIDKEALSQALDDIHTTASRSEALTSFSDFDAGTSARQGAKELVSGGISGLYTRLRQSVTGTSPESTRPLSRTSLGNADTASINSSTSSQPRIKSEREHRTSLLSAHTQDAVQTRSVPSSRAGDRARSRDESRFSAEISLNSDLQIPGSPLAGKKTANPSEITQPERTISSANKEFAGDGHLEDRNLGTKDSSRTQALRSKGSTIRPAGIEGSAVVGDLDDDVPSTDEGEASGDALRITETRSMQARQTTGTPDSKRGAHTKLSEDLARNVSRANDADEAPFMPLMPHSVTMANGLPTDLTKTAPGRINEKSLPTVNITRTSSTANGGQRGSKTATAVSTANTTPRSELPLNLNAGFKRAVHKANELQVKGRSSVPAHLKRRVVSKEFWMKDENARDCFYCGNAFSTFRRKHHCRTCGQIFDAKCTTLVSGRPFDLPGTLRLCKPCEGVIYGSDDDSTVFSDEDDNLRNSVMADRRSSTTSQHITIVDQPPFRHDDATLAAPSMGIPASRRNREAKRRSAVIEFDAHPALAEASSSRSLKSLGGRPRSSSHKRHGSKHQPSRNSRLFQEERGPFYQDTGSAEHRQLLPAFHNDNIIDPDLAPFMSDDGTDDDQASMFTVLNAGSQPSSLLDQDKAGFSHLLSSAVRKGRSRLGDRSSVPQTGERLREMDGRPPTRQGSKLLRRRNPSIASINFARPSPRRSRSQNHILQDLDDDKGSENATPRDLESLPQIRLEDRIKKSATMHGTHAPKVELNSASLRHVRKLLTQLLQDNKVENWKSWDRALLPILLQSTDDVDPDVQRGDDMDVRNYIKLKKITGGRPGDTAYISGVVFSKNVALKSMKRNFVRPRMAIVTFAIEYARYNSHFMSLEPVIAQEREYLRNLVGRIAALEPQVLLVQRNVSGLALQMLQESGITVVYNVKESVLAAVARVTRTIMIKTVDKLSMDPSHLGFCGNFDVKTYIHSGIKKTYIYISGCQPSLGCTVVLRGGHTEALRQVKRITEFMSYVVYNLRLETCLMRDEFVLIPSGEEIGLATEKTKPVMLESIPALTHDKKDQDNTATSKTDDDTEATHTGTRVETVPGPQEPQTVTVHDSRNPENPIETAAEDALPSQYRDLVESSRTRLLSSSPFVKYVEPHLLMQAQEQERRVERFKRLRDAYVDDGAVDGIVRDGARTADFEMVQPEMVQEVQSHQQSRAMRRFLFDVHNVQYQRALIEYEAKKKQWESFFEGSNGNPFDPFTHQNIFVLQSLVSSVTSAPCAGPEIIGLSFYADYEHPEMNYEDDCTLGQFVEDLCTGTNTACKTCNRKMIDHHRQYVHGQGQLSISVTRYPSKIRGLQNAILMWSTCKICNQETTVIPMSDNSWKYSFGKYLELSFWSTPLRPRAGLCPHDVHKDFVRCFGFQDHCVRVQYDKTELYEVLVPSGTINWAVHADLRLKNQLYSDCSTKLKAFIASVKNRLKSINLSTVTPEKTEDATAAVEKLLLRADDEYSDLLGKMQANYMSSRFYEVVPFNQTIKKMDQKAVAWDEAFADFERNYFPSETDIRRLATLQLKKLFLDRQETSTNDMSDTEDGVEMEERPRPRSMSLTDEELQSEKAQSMLTSVIEEQIHSDHRPLLQEHDSGENDIATVNPLAEDINRSRGLSISETERIVDGDNVKHLDLAVAHLSPEQSQSSADIPTIFEGLASPKMGPRNIPEQFAVEPKPLNPTLIERIEQMRSAAAGATNGENDNKSVDSRIPRLADLQRKGNNSPPPLNRAQSQPVHFPIRNNELNSIPTIGTITGTDGDDTNDMVPLVRGPSMGEISKSVENRLIERLGVVQSKTARSSTSLIPRSVPSKTAADNTTRVSALAKHFEQLSREFERERLRERRLRAARSRQNRANHLPSSQPVVEVYKDASEAVDSRPDEPKAHGDKLHRNQERERSDTDQHDYAQPISDLSLDVAETTDTEATDTDHPGSIMNSNDSDTEAEVTDAEHSPEHKSHVDSDTGTETGISSGSTLLSPASVPELELPLPKHEKSSLMKMLSSFWSERSASGWSPLEYPLQQTEHIFDDSDIIVREDEPSSVVALALSSNDYLKKLREFRSSPRGRGHSHQRSQDSYQLNEQARQQAAIEASLISETGTHMKYSFGHNQVKAQCKIFYAESFDALRRKCGVSDRFVESLSRSVKWDSKGGKTKSLFLKTLDDRFVIKSLQEVELKAFTRFAPDYFAFMSHTLFHGVPSVIAKMFGLFQVMIKNPATGVEFSSYLLVMENLFYDRSPTRRFDLKGSMRNRKIESTGQPDEVLLDENLVETIFETPLFVREHARKLVKASVWNDTMWLCKQNVMDYSLMAGFDDSTRQLTIGIIDCIRTYTWDKKLESWIKDRGKNKPTITSPKDYRNRFRVSMMQYVLQAPNVYHEFSRQMGPSPSLKMVEEAEERRRSGRDLGERDVLEGFREADGHFMDEAAMREMGSVMV